MQNSNLADKLALAAAGAKTGANCWIVHSESEIKAFNAGVQLAELIVHPISAHPESIRTIGKDGENIPISTIRELAFNSYMDSNSHKTYIINADSISTAGFNVLLKPMEESSTKTIWILCTKNLMQIPITIISRCRRLYIKYTPELGPDSKDWKLITQFANTKNTEDAIHLAQNILTFANETTHKEGDSKQAMDRAKLAEILNFAILFWKDVFLSQQPAGSTHLLPDTTNTNMWIQQVKALSQTDPKRVECILHACINARAEINTNATPKSILYKLSLSVL